MKKTNFHLKAARILRGLTQEAFAKKLGRSQSWVCQLERGLIEPDDLDVALICRLLKAPPDRVFPGELEGEHHEKQ